MNPGDNIKDWRGRDFRITRVEPVLCEKAAQMIARGWEPCVLTLEFNGRIREGYMSTADGSIHEAVRVDEAYPGTFA